MGALQELIQNVRIPGMAKVRQRFPARRVRDVKSALLSQLHKDAIQSAVKPGMRIAVTAGSRGIADLALILRTVVEFVQARQANPFIVPAMGSHGGATAEGQRGILAAYGISEESMGAPVLAAMETDRLCVLDGNIPVYMDAYAAKADGIILVNRTKSHTLFHGRYESGLMKMMSVGLGKQKGADTLHALGTATLSENIERFGNAVLRHANILFGVTTLENAHEQVCEIHALTPEEIPRREPELLLRAKSFMPGIYFENLHLLVVDYLGKDISGSGMDPNISFTFTRASGISAEKRARRVCVLDLTGGTRGCGLGLGMADVTTLRAYEKFDFEATYANALTTSVLESVKIPAVFPNQKAAIQAAVKTVSGVAAKDLRIVRIRDTLHLREIEISEALLKEAEACEWTEVLEPCREWVFDEAGNLF